MTRVFLDLSKAFDKVWYDYILYKLKRMGICRKYFWLMDSFLFDKFQRVLLIGLISKWSQIKAESSQSYILGPSLFLVYINDFPEKLTLTLS